MRRKPEAMNKNFNFYVFQKPGFAARLFSFANNCCCLETRLLKSLSNDGRKFQGAPVS